MMYGPVPPPELYIVAATPEALGVVPTAPMVLLFQVLPLAVGTVGVPSSQTPKPLLVVTVLVVMVVLPVTDRIRPWLLLPLMVFPVTWNAPDPDRFKPAPPFPVMLFPETVNVPAPDSASPAPALVLTLFPVRTTLPVAPFTYSPYPEESLNVLSVTVRFPPPALNIPVFWVALQPHHCHE
jgi:hypothetical protein